MRVAQLWHWIYLRGATHFDEMTNVGKGLRATLADAYTLDRPEVVVRAGVEGRHPQVAHAHAVHRARSTRAPRSSASTSPRCDRGTLCVSSQVGCTLTCSFCHTGTQRLVRNLTAAEIVAQLVVARDRLGDWPGATPARRRPSLPRESGRASSPTSCSWAWASRSTTSTT